MAVVYKGTDAYVAHMPGVKKAVHAHGREVKSRAERLLAQHRAQGVARIEGEVQNTDYLVSLVDKAALSIEYGREGFTREDGVRVGPMVGLRILGRAAEL